MAEDTTVVSDWAEDAHHHESSGDALACVRSTHDWTRLYLSLQADLAREATVPSVFCSAPRATLPLLKSSLDVTHRAQGPPRMAGPGTMVPTSRFLSSQVYYVLDST